MNIGMLWFDNDPKTPLIEKVNRAASYYRNKYGKQPTLCFVHPTMLPLELPEDKPFQAGQVELRSNRSVMPNHFWIGVDETPAPAESPAGTHQ